MAAMKLPPNILLFPERRVRRLPRSRTRLERLEDAIMPVVAIGTSLPIWALVGYAVWRFVASAF